jgi:hypothetical protein
MPYSSIFSHSFPRISLFSARARLLDDIASHVKETPWGNTRRIFGRILGHFSLGEIHGF